MQRQAVSTTSAADLKTDRVRVWLRLLLSTRAIETELNKRLRNDFSISVARFDVLAALARHREGLKMTALSSHLLITNGNATAIVERLVADGLVERLKSPADKRAILVRLTSAGVAEFDAFAATHDACVDQLLSPLDAADLRTLLSLFAKIGLARRTENRTNGTRA